MADYSCPRPRRQGSRHCSAFSAIVGVCEATPTNMIHRLPFGFFGVVGVDCGLVRVIKYKRQNNSIKFNFMPPFKTFFI